MTINAITTGLAIAPAMNATIQPAPNANTAAIAAFVMTSPGLPTCDQIGEISVAATNSRKRPTGNTAMARRIAVALVTSMAARSVRILRQLTRQRAARHPAKPGLHGVDKERQSRSNPSLGRAVGHHT